MPGRLEPQPLPRRDFLGISSLWAAGLAIFGSLLGMARLPKPRVLPEASNRVRVGSPLEYPPGTVKILPEQKVQIIATDQGIAALSLVCTHLGCIVSEVPDTGFLCPCHGSRFDLQGHVVGGPAPRSLPWLEVSQTAEGTLLINRVKEVAPGVFYQPIDIT
jgi:nitrite reductase/ring-hydroxylating ferredoxin subunit